MVPTTDPAFSDDDLNSAATQMVGQMSHQGIAPESHNSGDIATVGPADPDWAGSHNSSAMFGGGYGPE